MLHVCVCLHLPLSQIYFFYWLLFSSNIWVVSSSVFSATYTTNFKILHLLNISKETLSFKLFCSLYFPQVSINESKWINFASVTILQTRMTFTVNDQRKIMTSIHQLRMIDQHRVLVRNTFKLRTGSWVYWFEQVKNQLGTQWNQRWALRGWEVKILFGFVSRQKLF